MDYFWFYKVKVTILLVNSADSVNLSNILGAVDYIEPPGGVPRTGVSKVEARKQLKKS